MANLEGLNEQRVKCYGATAGGGEAEDAEARAVAGLDSLYWGVRDSRGSGDSVDEWETV